MEFFRIKKDIPFMRNALAFNVISLVTFLLAIFFLATKGLHLSVEFTGGTLIEVKYEQSADPNQIRGAVMGALQADAPGGAKQRVEFVGPQVGKELAENGAMALLLVIIGIVISLAFRLEC